MPHIRTVGELKKALENIDDKLSIQVILERNEQPTDYLQLEAVDVRRGTPSRGKDGRPGFKFDGKGLVTWAFLSIRSETGD